ncbi:hypothetical protein Q5Y73_07660 [Chengkuizengella sp. 2205SS18-9]|uniref:DUF2269 family protein n=1 Tax=Chengkuizengella axinellae TaxID=3064388 RepID=A0ABT9IXA5_9BACL|nr:hypothetical protein [Chengkuizengella sp. 2205SS18-9]MDP5273976.1 hypothetical protein [Chengkuizengella sp. 2205SS18-9]
MLYTIILYLHIFSVILAVGPIFVLFPLLNKLKKQIEFEKSIIDLVRFIVRLSKHAGHVLVTTGILLIWLGGWNWLDSWIVMTVLVLMCSIFFMARAFSPAIRKLESGEEGRDVLISKLKRSVIYYVTILLIAMWFMVQKPVLW